MVPFPMAVQPKPRPARVLVFPGGTECGLEIWRALRSSRLVNLFAANSDISNHAPYVFENYFVVPSIDEEGWIRHLNEVIRSNSIEFVYPTHDDVILALMEHESDVAARVITSPLRTCRICRSKSETYRLLQATVPVPRTYGPNEVPEEFPVFVKPDRGAGSRDVHLVQSPQELERLLARSPGHYIVSEHLPGDEFTVDCFSDRDQGLLYYAGRKRIRTRNGISVDTAFVTDPRFREFATAIGKQLELYGAWFFQLKEARDGSLKLMEVAPRIAGAMALDRVVGVNLPLLSVYEARRIPVRILRNEYSVRMDRALVNRYKHSLSYSTVYVDLDDTVIVKERVNLDLVRFLYQCVNLEKKVVLVTRNPGDVPSILRRYRLTDLFDEIRVVSQSASKADVIADRPSIFIDDSFREREEVAMRCAIPTLDSSMLELLASPE